MRAAGVQNIDSAAYLPPPPPTSTGDAKGTGAAGRQATDAQAANLQAQPSDFQSELALQQSGTQQSQQEPAGPPKTGTATRNSSKSGKKNVRPEDANLTAVTPVQVTEPQEQILPLALALAQTRELAQQQENAKPDDNAKPEEKATPDQNPPQPVQQAALAPSLSIAAVAQLPKPQQSAAFKPSVKFRSTVQPMEAPPNQTAVSNIAPSATLDSSKGQILPLGVRSSLEIPVRGEEVTKSTSPSSQDQGPGQAQVQAQDQAQVQAMTAAKAGGSSESQPVSRADLNLPATPAEPVAAAVQETGNSTASSPSALAFAARLSAAQQKTDQPVAANPVQSLAVSGSQTSTQIPARYAATAQIIQSATLRNEPGTQQDGSKKDAGASIERAARPDARTDMVMPRFESVSESAPISGSAAPQQAAAPARPEPIIEPPAVPPTSSHDIRVQVPDNKGGSTQVRFVESGGEVRVSVRTADEGLAQNLRSHLNDLTQRLSDGGMPAEIWKPASSGASSQNDSNQPNQEGRGSGGQGSGGQDGQQDRQQKRPAWLDEMEASLHGEKN